MTPSHNPLRDALAAVEDALQSQALQLQRQQQLLERHDHILNVILALVQADPESWERINIRLRLQNEAAWRAQQEEREGEKTL